jgi:hypothetical protein
MIITEKSYARRKRRENNESVQSSVFSPAAGLKSGQFNQKTNSGLAESDMRGSVKKSLLSCLSYLLNAEP